MAVTNIEIAEIFEQVADVLEIDKSDEFRIRAYRRAARTLRNLGTPIATLLERGDDITLLPTIGKDLAEKIEEIVRTGELSMLEDIEATMPAELAELARIPGIGAKRAVNIYERFKNVSSKDFPKAVLDYDLTRIPGIGKRVNNSVSDYYSAKHKK